VYVKCIYRNVKIATGCFKTLCGFFVFKGGVFKLVAIATGIPEIDNQLAQKITDSQIVHYREYLLKNKFETVIISPHLEGSIPVEDTIFQLRSRNTRIIFILFADIEDRAELIKFLITCGVYDIIAGSATIDEIVDIYNNPRTFADVTPVYLKVSGAKDITVTTKQVQQETEQADYKTASQEVEKIVEKVIKKEKIVEKEKVVEVEKPVFIQPVTVGVWSLDNPSLSAKFSIELAKGFDSFLTRKRIKSQIALVDFEEITPRIPSILKIQPCNVDYIVKLINSGDLTQEILEKHLVKQGNLKVFSGIGDDVFFTVNEKHLLTILRLINRTAYTVVNAGYGIWTSGVVTTFAESNRILVLVEATKFSVVKTLKILNKLEHMWGLDKSKIHICVFGESLTSEIDRRTVVDIAEQNNFKHVHSIPAKMNKTLPELIETLIGR